MQPLFGRSQRDDGNEWLSVSDLMAGLMVIFLFIAIVFIRPLAEENQRIRQIATAWQENETLIYEALLKEFRHDLNRWNAELEKETLLIRFKSPEVLFQTGSARIRPEFSEVLSNFFPRYVSALEPFRSSIEEIRIEGHTSSDWSATTTDDEAYFLNMELSQARTRSVLQYVLNLSDIEDERGWLQPFLTANGLSSSQPVSRKDGTEDPERSRRVEFRVRTKVRSEIVDILRQVQ